MTALLIVTTIGILGFGYYIAKRLGRTKRAGEPLMDMTIVPGRRTNRGILVFGANELAGKLTNAGIRCTKAEAENGLFSGSDCYSALFALSDNDWENIALCRKAKDSDSAIYILARCSQSNNRSYFEEAGADRVLMPDESAESVLEGLLLSGMQNTQIKKEMYHYEYHDTEHTEIPAGFNSSYIPVNSTANVRH